MVLVDEPLISMEEQDGALVMANQYKALSPADRELYDGLCTSSTFDHAELGSELRAAGHSAEQIDQCLFVGTRFAANGFNIEPERTLPFGSPPAAPPRTTSLACVFPRLSKMNHSCAPNVHAHYRDGWNAQVVYSLRDIQPGEELLIAYFKITDPRAVRQRRAQDWGFECTCEVCVPGPAATEHEELLRQIQVAMRLGMQTTDVAYGDAPGNLDRAIEAAIPTMRRVIALVEQKPNMKPALPIM